jgi:FkbM family methyltransferase
MLPVRPRPPWYFRLAQGLIAADRPGGWLTWRMVASAHRSTGILNQAAPFRLNETETVLMPLYWPQLVRKDRVPTYERYQTAAFADAVARLGADVIMVDCGADVGLFTRLVLRRSPNIGRVIAIEPNPKSHYLLDRNLSGVGVDAKAIRAAVSHEIGQATMRGADYNEDDHARYIDPTAGGDTPVITIDSLGLPQGRPVALKIDVEGEELNAIIGARGTLSGASDFLVQIEANADVVTRTDLDPVDIVRAVQEIRPIAVSVIHDHKGLLGTAVDLSKPFFVQYPNNKSCDILMNTVQ